jgi:hypothetical protein
MEKLPSMQVLKEKTNDPNSVNSSRKIGDLVFFLGIVISCFAEVALIGYVINLPHLYYHGVISDGLDFNTSLMLLIIGNLILFVEYRLKKSQ